MSKGAGVADVRPAQPGDSGCVARSVPKEVGEREAAARHFEHLQTGDLVLVDRGYPAFWLFALILSKKGHFCARFSTAGWSIVETFLVSGRLDQIVTLKPSAEARKECQARGLSAAPLQLRLLRIELDGGGVEVLGTSLLDQQAYPYALFKELYHTRWPVEEDYKVVKSRIEVENWSGESVLVIYQDFHAKIFTKNLTAIIAHPIAKVVAQTSQAKQYLYHPNMTHAVSKMKDTVVLLLQRANTQGVSLLKQLWQLLLKTIEPVRPGRSYPRVKRVKPKRFAMNYKPTR